MLLKGAVTSAPLSRNVNILQDSDFMSANKMFEAKAKLFTKEQNVKPKHKPSIEYGDMEKLNTAVSRKVVQQNRTPQYRKVSLVMGVYGI